MAKRERERPRQLAVSVGEKRRRVRRRRKGRRSPADSVFRLLFVDLLARFRSERGLPAISPVRMARLSDDELFEAVREARHAKFGAGMKKRGERDSRARRRGHEGR